MLTAPVRPTPWALRSRPADSLALRPATADDVVALAALKRELERRAYGHLASAEALSVRLHRRATAWWLLTRIAEGDLVLVVEDAGGLRGLGAVRVDGRLTRPRAHLHSVYVDEPGSRVEDALTAALLDSADRVGAGVVTADCFLGDARGEGRLRALGLVEVAEPSESPTFPGVGLSHWAGSIHTALLRVEP